MELNTEPGLGPVRYIQNQKDSVVIIVCGLSLSPTRRSMPVQKSKSGPSRVLASSYFSDMAIVWQTCMGQERRVTLLLSIALLREILPGPFQIFLKMSSFSK